MKGMKKQKLVEIDENEVAQKGIKEKQKLNETDGKNGMDDDMIMRIEWMIMIRTEQMMMIRKEQMIMIKMEWMMKMR
jgi:hypothetical protein